MGHGIQGVGIGWVLLHYKQYQPLDTAITKVKCCKYENISLLLMLIREAQSENLRQL